MATYNFWSNPELEPKRTYRWILELGGIPSWLVRTSEKPKWEMGTTKVNYLNHEFNYPARISWQPISVTLSDPIAPDASKTIEDIVLAAGYRFPEDPNDLSTVSKAGAVAALGNVALSQIGSEGEIIETWSLRNAYISDVDFGKLDYSSEDLVELSLTITYDYASLTRSGEPVPVASA